VPRHAPLLSVWTADHAHRFALKSTTARARVAGHTHKNAVHEVDGKWFINPGSITGAYSSVQPDVVPSFVLLAIQGAKVVTYVYELHGDNVEVSKSEFHKPLA